jgi:hypothetical protein
MGSPSETVLICVKSADHLLQMTEVNPKLRGPALQSFPVALELLQRHAGS